MENLQNTSSDELDVDGGWLITHHTQTWDTRVRLDSLDDVLNQKQADLDAAQQAFDAEQERVNGLRTQIDTSVAQSKQVPANP